MQKSANVLRTNSSKFSLKRAKSTPVKVSVCITLDAA
jgi:hypothetical protein